MNRCHWFLVFLLGSVLSIILMIISEFVKFKLVSYLKETNKPFVLLDQTRLQPVDEDRLSLILKPELANVSPRTAVDQKASENEALSSLHAALDMKQEGKNEKALRLFQHAASLAPKHPDVLNHYGEFLEETQKDVMAADQLYFQALTYCPTHSKALTNRLRTASVVEQMDDELFKRIDAKRDILAAIPETNRALIRAKKEAYFQHIYHTVGIEGNTMSLSQTRSIVETQMAVAGKSIFEHNEILGLDAAMKYINDSLVNRFGPILLKDILEIHRRVMGYVDPFGSGELRRTQVYVGGHMPPPPQDIPPRMRELEHWLNSEASARMHALQYAALAHYKLVHIHPFADGNGRTSRLLMNAILMQAGFPPVIIFKQDRHRYYDALDRGNQGDVRPFIRFIAECTEKTLDLFLWATHEFSGQVPALDDGHRTIVTELDSDDGQRTIAPEEIQSTETTQNTEGLAATEGSTASKLPAMGG